MNPSVWRVAALVFLAMALPLTAIILAFLKPPRPAPPAPDVPQLRASVEAVADKTLPPPSIEDGRRELSFPGTAEESEKRRVLIESAAAAVGGTALWLDGKLLVTVEPDKASTFELGALIPPDPARSGGSGDSVLYEISLPVE